MSATNGMFERLLEELLEADPRRSARAMEELRSPACQVEPTSVDRAMSTAALLLAIGQPGQACVLLESLLGRCPDQPMLMNNLAYAHLAVGRLDKALALWERAAVLAPADRLIRSNLARARQRRLSH